MARGWRSNDGRVVSNFIVQALRNQPITIYGDGTQTRSFCYVSDLIEGIWRLMNTEGLTGPVNIGNPNEFTIRELAEMVISLDRLAIGNRAPPAAAGRPRSAPAGHLPGSEHARLGAGRAPEGRVDADG